MQRNTREYHLIIRNEILLPVYLNSALQENHLNP